MSFQGLDPQEIDRTANSLTAQARTLEHITGEVDGLIRRALHHWEGHEADQFHRWWVQQHRPRLTSAAAGLHGAAKGLHQQANDQRRTSGQSQHGPGVAGFLGAVHQAFDSVNARYGGIMAGIGVLGGGATILKNLTRSGVTGRYSSGWQKVISRADSLKIPKDLFRFKTSPILQHFHPTLLKGEGLIKGASHGLGAAGKAFGAFGIASSAAAFGDNLGRGRYGDSALNAADGVATGLKSFGKTPLTYVGGILTQTVAEDVRAAQKVTWDSQLLKDVTSATPVDWGKAIWDSRDLYAAPFQRIFL